ncbi:MAG: hypothetical protein IJJ15_09990 [Ruminococcus sp.]|nr:hypothetical protein [Ruminococcus sp.]
MVLEKIKAFFKKLNYKSYILFYILLYAVMPIVPRATSTYLTTYFYMAIVVATFIFSFVACRLGNIKEYAVLMLPFIIYALLSMVLSHESDWMIAAYESFMVYVFPVSVGYYLARNPFNAKTFAIVLVVVFAFTCMTTIIGCIRNPDAARDLASTKTSQDATAIKYDWQNIGGYSFVYSTVLLYPFVILGFKTKKLNIVFVVIFTVLAYALALYTEYTFALMLLLLSTLLFLIKKDMSIKKFLLLMIFSFLAAYFLRYAVAALLTYIGNLLGNETMTEKMTAIFLGNEAVEQLDDPRDVLYMMSIETFLKNPLFGTFFNGGRGSGGHSQILDTLAQFGLFGGAILYWMYRGIYKVFYKPFTKKVGGCIVFWIFLQTFILSCINTKLWLNNLCLYTPILLYAIYPTEEKDEDTLDRKHTLRPAKLTPLSEEVQRSVDERPS